MDHGSDLISVRSVLWDLRGEAQLLRLWVYLLSEP
jgi:hypothetical protein